jgi:hypothetical protein
MFISHPHKVKRIDILMKTAKYSSNPGNKLKVVLHGKTCVSPLHFDEIFTYRKGQ